MDFFEKVKKFLLEPSKTFDAVKGENLNEALRYYLSILAIYLAILVVFALIPSNPMMGFGNMGMIAGAGYKGIEGMIAIFMMFFIALIVPFIHGAIVHIFVYLVGGRKGITQTIKAFMYGVTPVLLLGWIPIIGFITVIWTLVLEIIGIRQLHELTIGRAILAMFLPVTQIAVMMYWYL